MGVPPRHADAGFGVWAAARVHRDVNGSATICSKAVYGCYGQVQADTVTYLRPIGGAPLTRATSS